MGKYGDDVNRTSSKCKCEKEQIRVTGNYTIEYSYDFECHFSKLSQKSHCIIKFYIIRYAFCFIAIAPKPPQFGYGSGDLLPGEIGVITIRILNSFNRFSILIRNYGRKFFLCRRILNKQKISCMAPINHHQQYGNCLL